ncbi:MAG: hypothetical protein ACTHM6_04110 [Tepidisphaeraceae bacterium]
MPLVPPLNAPPSFSTQRHFYAPSESLVGPASPFDAPKPMHLLK